MKDLLAILRENEKVNAFFLVISSKKPRFTESEKCMFVLFTSIFGKKFFNNLSLVFTSWALGSDQKVTRNYEGISKK